MDKKALFYDIDGTLLSDVTGEVPASAMEALRAAQEKGHLTFINTGRTICSLPPELKEMPLAGLPVAVARTSPMGMRYCWPDPFLTGRGQRDHTGNSGVQRFAHLEGQEDCYFSSRMSRFEPVENTRRYFKRMGIGIETYIENDNFDYDKLVFYVDGQTDRERLFENMSRDMDIMDRKNGFYELAPKGYSRPAP